MQPSSRQDWTNSSHPRHASSATPSNSTAATLASLMRKYLHPSTISKTNETLRFCLVERPLKLVGSTLHSIVEQASVMQVICFADVRELTRRSDANLTRTQDAISVAEWLTLWFCRWQWEETLGKWGRVISAMPDGGIRWRSADSGSRND